MSKPIELPKRHSILGVGKRMGDTVYIHRSAAQDVQAKHLITHINTWYYQPRNWDVMKVDIQTFRTVFFECPRFDLDPCPEVGDSHRVNPFDWRGDIQTRKASIDNPFIYHHKWLMVNDDYWGFDIEEAKRFSRHWMEIVREREVSSRQYGRKKVWEKEVLPYL